MNDIVQYISDYQNPLVVYAYLIAIAFSLRAFLIVIPLIRIAKKYYRKGMLKKMFNLKRVASLKGIEGFIIAEILIMLLPGLIALVVRYGFLGPAPEIGWTVEQIMLGLVAGSLWLIVDVNQTIKTRKSLITVLNWYDNPNQINKILDDVLWTRERLEIVSKWEIEPNEVPEVAEDNLEKSTFSKIGNFLSSSIESVKTTVQSTLKDAAEAGVRRIDSTLQRKVDEVVKDSPPRRWRSFSINFTCSIWPFALIYYFLPLLI